MVNEMVSAVESCTEYVVKVDEVRGRKQTREMRNIVGREGAGGVENRREIDDGSVYMSVWQLQMQHRAQTAGERETDPV
jgi:hypothetical protein